MVLLVVVLSALLVSLDVILLMTAAGIRLNKLLFMASFFETIFYQPVLNLFIFIYNLTPGYEISLAVIFFAIAIKLILLPFAHKALISQKALQDLQPKLEALKKEHADNKEQLTMAMMSLYKDNKVNPFSSCLLMLVQLPFFIAVFNMFKNELSGARVDLLYPFITNPGSINTNSFFAVNFAEPNLILALLSGLAQFAQVKMMPQQTPTITSEGSKDENLATMMNKQMMYIFPVLTVFVCLSLPSGLAFYWLVITLLTILHQELLFKRKTKAVEVIQS